MQQTARALSRFGRRACALFVLALAALTFGATSAYASTQITAGMVQGTSNVTYTGAELDPITLGSGVTQMTKYKPNGLYLEQHNWQYKVTYEGDHTNVGTVKYTVVGGMDHGSDDKDYFGEITGTFDIHQADLANAEISFPSDVNNRYIQTGEAIKPKPQVSLDGGNTYLPESDYDVTYTDNAGNEVENPTTPQWYRVKVTAKSGNVTGQNTSLRFQIAKQAVDFDDYGVSVDDIADQTYKGEAIEPGLNVTTVTGSKLRKGLDYTASYENNVNVGTAKVTVTGAGVYEGTITKTFKINPLTLSKYDYPNNTEGTVWVDGMANNETMPYTGSPVTVDVHVVGYKGQWQAMGGYADPDGPTLKEGEDYTVTYSNNVDIWMNDNVKGGFSDYADTAFDSAKQPTVTITGKGNTQGAVSFTFNITPRADLGTAVLRDAPSLVFDGKTHALTPSDFGTKYINLSYEKNVFAYGLGGKEGIAYDVSYKDAAGNAVDADDVKDAGSYTMVLTGRPDGGFTGSQEIGFTIGKADFSDVSVADVEGDRYSKSISMTDGKAEPDFTLTLGQGDDAYQLVKGKDYDISYAGNTTAGYARATITPKGNFAGGNKIVTFNVRSDEEVAASNALNDAIEQAKAVAQGDKTDAAYAALQQAIAAAEAVDSEDVSVLTTAKDSLEAAVKAFNDSASVQTIKDKEAADAVAEQIAGLPDSGAVTDDSESAIKAARAAYDALNDDAKAMVPSATLNRLTDAEAALQRAKEAAAKKTDTKKKAAKKANPVKAKAAKKTVKYKALKKRAQTVAIKVTGAKGKVTFAKAKKTGIYKKASVSKKGKVTFKKGAKKGTYSFKVKAAGNASYKAKTVTVKIKVK